MMDVIVVKKNNFITVSFRTSVLDINKAEIIEKIVFNLPSCDKLSLDLKGVKSIDMNGFKYLQSMIGNLDDIKIINLQDKYKKLVS